MPDNFHDRLATDMLLDPLWDRVRATSYPTSDEALTTWLEAPPHTQARGRLHPARPLVLRPRFVTAMLLFMGLLVLGLMPMQQAQHLGYILMWHIETTPEHAPDFLQTHDWIDPAWLSLSMQPGQAGVTFLVAYPPSHADSLTIHQAYLSADSTALRVRLHPIEQSVQRRGYELAMSYIKLSSEQPLVNDQIEQRLRSHLEDLGLTQPQVRYEQQDGSKQIEITTPYQP